MLWNRKDRQEPRGIRLRDLESVLGATALTVSRKGAVLIARHEHYATHIEVVAPEREDAGDARIQAVVRVVSELPSALGVLFEDDPLHAANAFNGFAALGALTVEGGSRSVGSRLTVFDGDGAWQGLHLPLLVMTTICATEAILGAMRRTLAGEPPRGGTSSWTARDFTAVADVLRRFCVCNADAGGLTAEFGLRAGAASAIAGDRHTALFQLVTGQPHPELGGGLLCLLQMPQRIADAGRLARLCQQLNRMEMAAHDLPPHVGAWCSGRLGNNPAYVSFLPDALHRVAGIATNAAIWASARAQWANAMLAGMGVEA